MSRIIDNSDKLAYKLFIDGEEKASGTREEMGQLYDTTEKVGHFVQILFITRKRWTDYAKQRICEHEEIEVYRTSMPVKHNSYIVKRYFRLDGKTPLSKAMNEEAEQKRAAFFEAMQRASTRQFLYDRHNGSTIN